MPISLKVLPAAALRTTRKSAKVFCLYILGSLTFFSASHAQTPEPAKTETTPAATTETKATDTETTTAAIPSNDELLAQQSPEDQIWWLNADKDKFLGLYISEETGHSSYGATLILPDPGRPADWPALTRTLRELLPKHRWHTLAINPSVSPNLLTGRIEAAVKELRSKNINNIAVIAEGKTALGALEYTQTHAGEIRALVLLNPSHKALEEPATNDATKSDEKTAEEKDQPATEKTAAEESAKEQTKTVAKGQTDKLLESISKLTIPCLDMATGSAIDEIELAKQRLSVSRGLQRGQYQQVSLPGNDYPDSVAQENPISKRVRGWLGKHALPVKPQTEAPKI